MASTMTRKHLDSATVERVLDLDESNGHAVAVFRIERGQTAWQPKSDLPTINGPCTVLYERQFGKITGSAS